MNVDILLRDADHERFKTLEYDASPTVRALLCRELAGLSWKGLYEYLSTDARAIRLGFDSDLRERHVGEFSDDQIRRTIRLARDTVFGAFESGRAENAIYPDSRFDELQALMSLFECGTPQGQSRMANFFGADYTPHGDTHLRTVQQYSQAAIQAGFEQSIENLLDAVNHLQILQPPVTAAIDITTWPYHAEDDLPPEVSGTKRADETAYKFATLSLVGKNMPIVLAFESVIESSSHGRPRKTTHCASTTSSSAF